MTPTIPWYRKPLWLGLLALALMVGGWKLSTFVPAFTGQMGELHRMASDDLRTRLDQMRPPPYQWPGRLLFLAGTALFVLAGVQMFRQPTPPPATPGEDEVEEDLAEAHPDEV